MKQLLEAGAVVMDPPWAGQGAPYPTLSLKRIMAFPLASLISANCHLYLWVPNGMAAAGVAVAEHFGFTVRGVITWVKSRPGRPTRYLQANTELLLFCTRGDAPARIRGQQTILFSPTLAHSQKPDEQYAIVERLSQPPYLELFARSGARSEQWIAWGNELEQSGLEVPGWPVSSDFLKEAA